MYKGGFDGKANHFFYAFPKTIKEEVIKDSSLMSTEYFSPKDHDLRKKAYDNDQKCYTYTKTEFTPEFKAMFNKNFYDVTIESKDYTSFTFKKPKPDGKNPDGSIKWLEEDVEVSDCEFSIYGLGENKLKDLMLTMELDVGVELIDGKDKTGEPCKRLPYSFVHDTKDKLLNKPFSFRTTGTPGTTELKYIFKEVADFTSAKTTADNTFNADRMSTVDELTIADITF